MGSQEKDGVESVRDNNDNDKKKINIEDSVKNKK